MIEFRHRYNNDKTTGGWVCWPSPSFRVVEDTFYLHEININGKFYKSWTAEFEKAYEQELMWEKLHA